MEGSNQKWENRKVTPWKTERRRWDGEEKPRMTYFSEIRAWRDKRYLQKTGEGGGGGGVIECGCGEGEKKTLKRMKGNIERQSSDSG